MRNMKFVKRIGAAALAACMVLSCVGCGSSSNKGAAEGTTEVTAEGGQTKISVAAAASLQPRLLKRVKKCKIKGEINEASNFKEKRNVVCNDRRIEYTSYQYSIFRGR